MLSDKTNKRFTKQPSQQQETRRYRVGAEDLGEKWRKFLGHKFTTTTLEKTCVDYEDLGTNKMLEEDQLNIKEYLEAVQHMKRNEAVGPDGVPVTFKTCKGGDVLLSLTSMVTRIHSTKFGTTCLSCSTRRGTVTIWRITVCYVWWTIPTKSSVFTYWRGLWRQIDRPTLETAG